MAPASEASSSRQSSNPNPGKNPSTSGKAEGAALPSFVIETKTMRAPYQGHPPDATPQTWNPPTRSQSLIPGSAQYFRWSSGTIHRLQSRPSGILQTYQTASIFCEGPTLAFRATNIDATRQDVISNTPLPYWSKVHFRSSLQSCRPNQQYSYIDFVAPLPQTASPMPGHITPQLVPYHYNQDRGVTRQNAGLIGELTLLIGLAIFSARSERTSEILTTCIQPRRWIHHQYSHGRESKRGVVVTIYFDPANPDGSTRTVLDGIRDGRQGPFYGPQ